VSPDLTQELHRWKLRRATAHEVTEDLATFVDGATDTERPVFQIRPYPGDGGVHRAISLLDDMHRVRRSRLGQNVSAAHSYEIWHEPGADGVLSFNVAPGPEDAASVFEQLMEDLPNSEVRQRTRAFPDLDPGWYVAGARSSFFKSSVYPIRHVNIDGFADGDSGARDPYKSVLTKVAQEEDVGVLLQTVFRPTTGSWLEDSRRERASARLRSETTVTDWLRLKRYARKPTDVETTAADIIEGQQHAEQFGVSLRLLVWGEDPGATERRLQAVGRALGQYYESHTQQGIAVEPAGVPTLGLVGGRRDLRNVLRDTAERWIRTPLVGTAGEKTVDAAELAGLVHAPGEDVNHAAIDRSESKSGIPVPNRTPRFDYEAAGIERHATPHDRQRALLREPDAGDPFYVGFGARKGTEAGIFSDVLATHAVIPGRTGVGKTTAAENLFFQVVNRGHGALYYDPKGTDAETFARLVPESREDDLVFIELGSDREHQVGFNFLSVPGTAEPGTAAYASALEAMADDLEAILPMASGDDDDSWGTRMSRITRNLCRGLGRMDDPACILDMQHALATETGRKSYAGRLSEENIRFIEDYAQNHLAEMHDDAIEPLAGRLQQLVENEIVRDIISIRDGFDVDEAVADGKVLIVQDATASGTTGKMVAAALIRRIWVAVREQSHAEDRQDPPPFFAFLDEFNEIASQNSGLVQILQDARAFGLSVVAMLQDMESDLDTDVAAALEGQTETKLTYNPGRDSFARTLAAHHSDGIDLSDLMNLSPYTFYMRTRNQQDTTTRSYKVNAFPPVSEVIPEVCRPEAETAALIDRRIREVGEPRQTAEEQREGVIFEDAPTDTLRVTDAVERAAVQGVYDVACRTGDPGGAVTLTECGGAVRRRVAALSETPEDTVERLDTDGDVFRRILQHVDEDLLEIDGEHLRARSRPFLAVGEDQSAGSIEHSALLREAYPVLTAAGASIDVLDASGTDPDALIRPAADAETTDLIDWLVAGSEARLEASSSTGRSKPAADAWHAIQAANEGRTRCVTLVRPDDAQNVADTLLADPPLCRTDRSTADKTHFYNSPRFLRDADGEVVTRPGSTESVWFRDETTGEIVLADDENVEHARYEGAGAVFSGRAPHPQGGETQVRRPIIPEALLEDGATPRVEVLTVPEGADSLAEFGLVVDADGSTLPLTEGYPTQSDESRNRGVTPADLDVPDRAARLLNLLQEHGEPVTTTEARTLAAEHDADLDRSYQTTRNWITALVEAEALEEDGEDSNGATRYRVD